VNVRRQLKAEQSCRAGLAPLELVLSLPILLMVMALIVIMGHAGVWKVRTHTNARQAAWRSLYPRSGAQDPYPAGWPEQTAEMGTGDSEPPLFEWDPFDQWPVVRGPRFVEPFGHKSIPVRRDQFDMRLGLLEGSAGYEGRWPFLQVMPPGRFDLKRQHPVLDDCWQFTQQGLGSNQNRKLQFLYPVDLRPFLASKIQRYEQAAIAIVANPYRSWLRPLDRDPEVGNRDYHRRRFPLHPDLVRKLRDPKVVCSFDPEVLRRQVAEPLIEEIKGSQQRPRAPYDQKWGRPGVMTGDHLEVYGDRLETLQQQLQSDPNPSPDLIAQIQILETYIDQLEKFRDEVLVP